MFERFGEFRFTAKIAAITFMALCVLVILDIASTYYTVCMNGGFELNLVAIKSLAERGFIGEFLLSSLPKILYITGLVFMMAGAVDFLDTGYKERSYFNAIRAGLAVFVLIFVIVPSMLPLANNGLVILYDAGILKPGQDTRTVLINSTHGAPLTDIGLIRNMTAGDVRIAYAAFMDARTRMCRLW